MKKLIITLTVIVLVLSLGQAILADCALAHTHIGINPTLRPDWSEPGNRNLDTDTDSTDNNKLWMFSLPPVHSAATPNWPDWGYSSPSEPFLQLIKVPDYINGGFITKPGDSSRYLWTCNFIYNGTEHLDGFHSAHGPGGMWSLESVDQLAAPDWDIYIKREGTSLADPTDFFMAGSGIGNVLTADGSDYQLNKMWLDDFNAWGIHEHLGYYFYLPDGIGQEVSATLSAYDASGQYGSGDPYEFRFVTVPEPTTIALLTLGITAVLKKRRVF